MTRTDQSLKLGDYVTIGFFTLFSPVLIPVALVGWAVSKLTK